MCFFLSEALEGNMFLASSSSYRLPHSFGSDCIILTSTSIYHHIFFFSPWPFFFPLGEGGAWIMFSPSRVLIQFYLLSLYCQVTKYSQVQGLGHGQPQGTIIQPNTREKILNMLKRIEIRVASISQIEKLYIQRKKEYRFWSQRGQIQTKIERINQNEK